MEYQFRKFRIGEPERPSFESDAATEHGNLRILTVIGSEVEVFMAQELLASYFGWRAR